MAETASRIGASLEWDPLTGIGSLVKEGDMVRFAAGFPYFRFGSGTQRVLPAAFLDGSIPRFPKETFEAISKWFSERDAERASRFSVAAILIDAGHGGRDPGAMGEHAVQGKKLRVVEKDLALALSLDIASRLREKWPGKRILLSREGDTYPTLEERVDMANRVDLAPNEAIIYVSIHANASFNKGANGFEVWYLNPEYRRPLYDGTEADGLDSDILSIKNTMLEEEFTTESTFLAKRISDALTLSLGNSSPNRGIRPEEWFVVRNAKMPSVLVEMGFVTNPDEALLLSDPAYLRKVGDGVYNGITSFVEYFERYRGTRDR